jgi:hypothetical protein
MFTTDSSEKSSYQMRDSSQKRNGVFTIYDEINKINTQSIFSGGLDTGIDYGKFVIDTSNNIGTMNHTQDSYADRFIGPYARTQLNNQRWLNSVFDQVNDGDEQLSELRS